MDPQIIPVDLAKAARLLNHGPTVLVSAHHAGMDNVMAAAWACALDFTPPKLTVVLDKSTMTRELVEQSGVFGIQVPTVAQLQLTLQLGTLSRRTTPDKLERTGVELFRFPEHDMPFVNGCSAWMACKLLPEPRNQQVYDLFIGEIVAAWADSRVFSNGRWHFENAEPALRSIHHVAGGHFYAIGEAMNAPTVKSSG
ncbi:MAG: flavin reductase family protein [Betaproteobacteria bacterium]|nr:flavin reductase family protein [Betaproteobacteria bacterium]